jgi:hypothetical protein
MSNRPDPDPMCPVCNGTGFLPTSPEDEPWFFEEVKFCECWAGRKSSHYTRQVH